MFFLMLFTMHSILIGYTWICFKLLNLVAIIKEF